MWKDDLNGSKEGFSWNGLEQDSEGRLYTRGTAYVPVCFTVLIVIGVVL